MTKKLSICLAISFFILAFSTGCENNVPEGSSTINLGGNTILVLPAGHPGVVTGSTLVLPSEATPPTVHYANCFAGVENDYDFGIGSSAGATKTNRGYVIIPVNINVGDTVLGQYRIRIDVSDPSVVIDLANILGSNPLLSIGDCALRGCPPGCGDYPAWYSATEFNAAAGFEKAPDVTGAADGVTIQSADTTDLSNPTTGKANLVNIRLNIVGDLPAAGVVLTFTVDLLEHPDGHAIPRNPISGLVIKNFQLQ